MEPDGKHIEKPSGGDFATTRWSVIIASRQGRGAEEKARDALAELCRIYRKPVHDFILRKNWSPEDAEDLVQEFFMKIISSDFLIMADQERGKFRALLLTSLKNFLINAHESRHAQKRNGKHVYFDGLPENDLLFAATADWTPEGIYDLGWAATLSERAMNRLREECMRAGREKVYTELSPFLAMNVADWDYQKVAGILGIPVASIHTLVFRLRERYSSLLRAEIAETVHEPGEIEEELRYLHRLLTTGKI